MAKKSSVHGQPAPPHNSRMTRSQSVGLHDSTSSLTRLSRRSGVRPTGRIGSTKSERNRNVVKGDENEEDDEEIEVGDEGDEAAPDNDLTAVAEEGEDLDGQEVYPNTRDVFGKTPGRNDRENVRSKRLSSRTSMSGTTANTPFSQAEADQLTPQDMIDDLKDLANASERVARFVAPRGASTPPEWWKSFNRARHAMLSDRVMSYKQSFGSSDLGQKYISLRTAARTIFSTTDLEEATWRPDDILYRVNLNEMIDTLLAMDVGRDKHGNLQDLDSIFAASIAGPVYDPAALTFWCHLATQLAIIILDDYSEEDDAPARPSQIIEDLFFVDDNFRHEASFGITAVALEIHNDAMERIQACARSIFSVFKNDDWASRATAVGNLRSRNPWDDFIQHALTYYDERKLQLNRSISAAGGIDHIIEALTHEAQRRADIKHTEDLKRQLLTQSSRSKKNWRKSLDSMAALKQQDRRLRQLSSMAPVAQMVADPVKLKTAASPPQQDPESLSTTHLAVQADIASSNSPKSTSRSSIHEHGQDPGDRTKKKKSLMDRQPTARRLDWNESQSQASPRATRAQTPAFAALESSAPSRGSKRRADDDADTRDDFEPTQDEGFENDERDTTEANKRRRAIAATSSNSSVALRQRSSAAATAAEPATAGPTSSAPPPYASRAPDQARVSSSAPVPARRNPGALVPSLVPPAAPGDEAPPASGRYADAKMIAKQNRVKMPKRPQTRVPWSLEEEEHLVRLIEENCDDGISWVALKQIDISMGNLLEVRTSENLREKARNMKVTFLKEQGALPQNWEKVMIDKKAIEQIRAYGIPYEQGQMRIRTLE